MPISEAANDTPTDLVRTRFRDGLTEHVRGVDFVDGVAGGPMTRRDAEFVAACMPPHVFEIVGPWATPAAPAKRKRKAVA